MGKCNICNKDTSFWTSRKTFNGEICADCAKKVYGVVRNKLQDYDDIDLISIINYKEKLNKNIKTQLGNFEPTASYGYLQIDEINGLFCICKNNEIDIFNAIDLIEVGLYCSNISADSHSNVYADVELKCSFENPPIDFSTIVKKHVKCYKKKDDGSNIEWLEPNDLIMFKTLFNQMMHNADAKIGKKLTLALKNKKRMDLLKAKALFMVEDDYTLEQIRNNKRLLMKSFHPDENINYNNKYAQIINSSYEILANNLDADDTL